MQYQIILQAMNECATSSCGFGLVGYLYFTVLWFHLVQLVCVRSLSSQTPEFNSTVIDPKLSIHASFSTVRSSSDEPAEFRQVVASLNSLNITQRTRYPEKSFTGITPHDHTQYPTVSTNQYSKRLKTGDSPASTEILQRSTLKIQSDFSMSLEGHRAISSSSYLLSTVISTSTVKITTQPFEQHAVLTSKYQASLTRYSTLFIDQSSGRLQASKIKLIEPTHEYQRSTLKITRIPTSTVTLTTQPFEQHAIPTSTYQASVTSRSPTRYSALFTDQSSIRGLQASEYNELTQEYQRSTPLTRHSFPSRASISPSSRAAELTAQPAEQSVTPSSRYQTSATSRNQTRYSTLLTDQSSEPLRASDHIEPTQQFQRGTTKIIREFSTKMGSQHFTSSSSYSPSSGLTTSTAELTTQPAEQHAVPSSRYQTSVTSSNHIRYSAVTIDQSTKRLKAGGYTASTQTFQRIILKVTRNVSMSLESHPSTSYLLATALSTIDTEFTTQPTEHLLVPSSKYQKSATSRYQAQYSTLLIDLSSKPLQASDHIEPTQPFLPSTPNIRSEFSTKLQGHLFTSSSSFLSSSALTTSTAELTTQPTKQGDHIKQTQQFQHSSLKIRREISMPLRGHDFTLSSSYLPSTKLTTSTADLTTQAVEQLVVQPSRYQPIFNGPPVALTKAVEPSSSSMDLRGQKLVVSFTQKTPRLKPSKEIKMSPYTHLSPTPSTYVFFSDSQNSKVNMNVSSERPTKTTRKGTSEGIEGIVLILVAAALPTLVVICLLWCFITNKVSSARERTRVAAERARQMQRKRHSSQASLLSAWSSREFYLGHIPAEGSKLKETVYLEMVRRGENSDASTIPQEESLTTSYMEGDTLSGKRQSESTIASERSVVETSKESNRDVTNNHHSNGHIPTNTSNENINNINSTERKDPTPKQSLENGKIRELGKVLRESPKNKDRSDQQFSKVSPTSLSEKTADEIRRNQDRNAFSGSETFKQVDDSITAVLEPNRLAERKKQFRGQRWREEASPASETN